MGLPGRCGSRTVQLSLNDALELGLRQNPDIITFRRNEAVGISIWGVAETYPSTPSSK